MRCKTIEGGRIVLFLRGRNSDAVGSGLDVGSEVTLSCMSGFKSLTFVEIDSTNRLSCGEQTLKQDFEFVKINRLRDVFIASGGECFSVKVRRVVGGYGEDGNFAEVG